MYGTHLCLGYCKLGFVAFSGLYRIFISLRRVLGIPANHLYYSINTFDDSNRHRLCLALGKRSMQNQIRLTETLAETWLRVALTYHNGVEVFSVYPPI